MLHGPIFNTFDTQKKLKEHLAKDVLHRLNSNGDGLGDLVREKLVAGNIPIKFNKYFKSEIKKVLPDITKAMAKKITKLLSQNCSPLSERRRVPQLMHTTKLTLPCENLSTIA